MVDDWTLVTKIYHKHKANLTRAKNRKDWPKVREVCRAAFADFEAHGYPDNWSLFQRGDDDAVWEMRYAAEEREGRLPNPFPSSW